MSTWWFMASRYGDDVVRSFGPYPTQELCRMAGQQMTDDWRFLTEEDAAERKRMFDQKMKERDVYIAEAVASPHFKAGWLELHDGWCSGVYLDATGRRGPWGGVPMTVSWKANSGCVEVRE